MSIRIDMKKVDEKIVDKYLAHYGLTVKGAINAKVNALERHTFEHVDEKDHSTPCTVCGGVSDFNLDECPYCGATEISSDAPVDVSRMAQKIDAVVDDPVVVEQQPEQAAAAANEEPRGLRATVAAAAALALEPAPMATAATSKKGMRKKAPAEQKLAQVKGNGKANGHGAELVPARELDDAVARVQAALRSGATSYWELGRALLDIHEGQLWKQRIVAGRQKFQSWNLFCRDELKMSHVNAYSIMDAAKAFSKKDFEDLGHSKLQLLLRLPKERAQQLAEEARKGQLPRARLKEIVEAEVPKGHRRDTGRKGSNNPKQREASVKGAEARRAQRQLPKPDGELTAVSQLGRSTVKLYARPKKDKKPQRAISITQDPWGEVVLVNGVIERFTVIKTKTGLELVIERKRGE